MVLEHAKQHADRASGVSNVAYDLLATMTRKLEGIAALEEYVLDASQAGDQEVMALFERLDERARQDVAQVRVLLVERLRAKEGWLADSIASGQDEVGD